MKPYKRMDPTPSSQKSRLPEHNHPHIVCDNLVKIYKISNLEVVALQGLDLVVNRGEMLGLIGVSGSGKSTLLNILGGLDRPSAGRVWVDRNDLLNMSNTAIDHYRREEVGFVWQQSSRNLIPYLTAAENVELPMVLAGKSARENKKRVVALLETVGLKDRINHNLSELSGGEQQRVAIAVSLANNPKLLLADEPTGEVDEITSLAIYDAFRALNHSLNLTTLIVSHDPGIAQHVDRVVAIRDGKTATETVRQSRSDDPAHNEEFDQTVGSTETIFEELTVLDSVGRLQIPEEYLEMFNIRGRVRLEVSDDGIMILPVKTNNDGLTAEDAAHEIDQSIKKRGSIKNIIRSWQKISKQKE